MSDFPLIKRKPSLEFSCILIFLYDNTSPPIKLIWNRMLIISLLHKEDTINDLFVVMVFGVIIIEFFPAKTSPTIRMVFPFSNIIDFIFVPKELLYPTMIFKGNKESPSRYFNLLQKEDFSCSIFGFNKNCVKSSGFIRIFWSFSSVKSDR